MSSMQDIITSSTSRLAFIPKPRISLSTPHEFNTITELQQFVPAIYYYKSLTGNYKCCTMILLSFLTSFVVEGKKTHTKECRTNQNALSPHSHKVTGNRLKI
jgi:hypothetical protein